MVRNQVALLCTALLLWSSSASANGACQVAAAPPQGVKEQFTQIPAGSVVEVKLADKHKIRGRLGSITDSGFDLPPKSSWRTSIKFGGGSDPSRILGSTYSSRKPAKSSPTRWPLTTFDR